MPVELDGETLTPDDVVAVARGDADIRIAEAARERVRDARSRVEDVIESGEPVYGLNTGFGELVDERIPVDQVETLQMNLIRSHAAGAGRLLTRAEVRAMMVARINALVKGYSGVREELVDALVQLCNNAVHPVVNTRGSLGASGDLSPLAHMSLVLLGEGAATVDHPDGERRLTGAAALASVGLEPFRLEPKEGLALINGTQLTVGLASLLLVDAERLVTSADVVGALTTEMTLGTTATSDPAIHAVRPFDGQRSSAANVRRATASSDIVEAHRNCDRVQDPYSLRCLPQVHGAVRDAIAHLRQAVEIELNSATDNPLVFDADRVDDRASGTDRSAVISGGNFHGAPLALRLEYLRMALVDLANIGERRIDLLLNPNRQEPHLPPFLAVESGVESGYMIAQYTAASLLAEIRSIGAAAMDNTPVSGGQEDHVSNSAQSALHARRTLHNVRQVLAVELVCAAEAREHVDFAFDGTERLELGLGTAALYECVREVVPPLETDRPVHEDIASADALLQDDALLEAIKDAVGASLN